MTREQVKRIKEAINVKERGWKTRFDSKTGEFSITLSVYVDGHEKEGQAKAHSNIISITQALTVYGMRPRFRIKTRRYQGFLNHVVMVF